MGFMGCQMDDKQEKVLLNITPPKPDKPFASSTPVRTIEAGTYVPLYGNRNKKVSVKSFQMDVYPVSHADFQAFVRLNPRWQRGQIPSLYADANYLRTWASDTTFSANPLSPIHNVSWFAAKAYCQCQGKRLPTVDEWEYVAMANETLKDARTLSTYNQEILDGYESPKTYLKSIGQQKANAWGIHDLHGLVWEWTADFNTILLTGESRNDTETDKDRFCGSGSLNATDLMNYAAFMRYAFRGSLNAKFSVQNLGFRCVKDFIQKPANLDS